LIQKNERYAGGVRELLFDSEEENNNARDAGRDAGRVRELQFDSEKN